MNKSLLVLGTLLVAAAAPSRADHIIDSAYWHAFASQGAIYTSDNNFYGESDDGLSTEFRELGLILGAKPLDNVSLVAQILSRETGEVDETDLRLDYAFASYTPFSSLNGDFGIKAGRIRAPIGFFNETRDVAHTRPGILLPQSVYPDRIRNLTFARDGAQLFGSYQHGLNAFSWDLSYSRLVLRETDYDEIIDLGVDIPGDVETPFSPVARIMWDWDMGRVRLGLSYADYSANYRAASMDFFNNADLSFRYWITSAEYNAANWSLISEYSHFKSTVGDLLPEGLGVRYESKGHAYYVQAVYRPDPAWDLFVRWEELYSDDSRRSDPFYSSQEITLGVGWRPDSHWLLRAEWHLVDGLGTLSTRENDRQDMQRRWQMLLFQIAYRI